MPEVLPAPAPPVTATGALAAAAGSARRRRVRDAPARRRAAAGRSVLGVDRAPACICARRRPSWRPRRGAASSALVAARGARAGRLHPRPQGLPPDLAGGRPARADPAARDRAARRGRAARCRRARASSTSGPAAARSRSRSSDERPDLDVLGHRHQRRRARGGARQRRSGSASTSAFCEGDLTWRPGAATPCSRTCPTSPRARRCAPEIARYEPAERAVRRVRRTRRRSAGSSPARAVPRCSRSRSGSARRRGRRS